MALSDEVKSRFSTVFLKQLTNPNNTNASAIDDPHLDKASSDVLGDFIRILGRAFDLALPQDVAVAVDGVIAKLRMRLAQPTAAVAQKHEEYITAVRGLIQPARSKTSSVMQPTPEQRGTEPVRPSFDTRVFDDFVPGPSVADPLGNS